MIAIIFLFYLSHVSSFTFHGATAPLGVFDPFKFQDRSDITDLARYRESELKHGRWAMLSAASIPLIESKTHLPAIHEFDHLPDKTKLLIVMTVLMGEAGSMIQGWKNPFVNGTKNYFKLNSDYQPGDMGFELSNPDDVNIYNKELNNGRLAMIASAGMIVQELVFDKPIFQSSIY